jgi:hypothetical protein
MIDYSRSEPDCGVEAQCRAPVCFAKMYGLNPLVAFTMFATDHMLFVGLELPSFEALCVLSMLVGWALIIPCMLIQRYGSKDGWLLAFGKAVAVGVIVAIPTSIPSVLTAGWGLVGLVGMFQERKRRVIDTEGWEV